MTVPTALLTTDLAIAKVAGAGDFAVVVHVPADSFGLLQEDELWQQPQSAVTFGWSFGFVWAPLVPWDL